MSRVGREQGTRGTCLRSTRNSYLLERRAALRLALLESVVDNSASAQSALGEQDPRVLRLPGGALQVPTARQRPEALSTARPSLR